MGASVAQSNIALGCPKLAHSALCSKVPGRIIVQDTVKKAIDAAIAPPGRSRVAAARLRALNVSCEPTRP
jgi:hypothetical protein